MTWVISLGKSIEEQAFTAEFSSKYSYGIVVNRNDKQVEIDIKSKGITNPFNKAVLNLIEKHSINELTVDEKLVKIIDKIGGI